MGFLAKAWAFITTGIMPKVIEWAGIAAGLFTTWALIKKSGETAIELKEEANTLEGVKARDKIESEVGKLSDSDITDELRKRGELRD